MAQRNVNRSELRRIATDREKKHRRINQQVALFYIRASVCHLMTCLAKSKMFARLACEPTNGSVVEVNGKTSSGYNFDGAARVCRV